MFHSLPRDRCLNKSCNTVQNFPAADEEIIDDTNEQGTYFMDQQGHYYFQANSDSQSALLTEAVIDDGAREICETSQDVTMVDCNEEVCIIGLC